MFLFRKMVCEDYYDHHPPFDGEGDQCHRPEIEGPTAQQIAILGMTTTFCGTFFRGKLPSPYLIRRIRDHQSLRCRLAYQALQSEDRLAHPDVLPGRARSHPDCRSLNRGQDGDNYLPGKSTDRHHRRPVLVQGRVRSYRPRARRAVAKETDGFMKARSQHFGKRSRHGCRENGSIWKAPRRKHDRCSHRLPR